jgi:hypothetical protein
MLSSGMGWGRSAVRTGSSVNLLAHNTVATFFRYPHSAWLVYADRREAAEARLGMPPTSGRQGRSPSKHDLRSLTDLLASSKHVATLAA